MDQKEIKKHKGRLVSLRYKTKAGENELTGEITAATKQHILFNVNKEQEIILNYGQVINKPTKPVK